MRVYYNEIDTFAADWLEQLIAVGAIPAGVVDRRDIRDVLPSELDGYDQCHFFAGIGGWAYALQLAGWPDGCEVWTGSCPCQPFSAAGRGGGFADERHLWPAFFHLIRNCRPQRIFGEQVASKSGLGWLDLVRSDLEGAGYAVGAADLCAAGVGAPHIRQRLFWMGDTPSSRSTWQQLRASDAPPNRGRQFKPDRPSRSVYWSDLEWLPCRDGKARPTQRRFQSVADGLWPSMVESGTEYLSPLAKGQTNRVGMLRGAGNAIVPQAAAEFIRACLDEDLLKMS